MTSLPADAAPRAAANAAPNTAASPPTKGERTRDAVLREGLAWASTVGLQGLSIGGLAERMGLSKSGVYAHVESKEQLQDDVLGLAVDHFVALVVQPALAAERGEPRLRRLVDRWLGWFGYADYALPGGCIFVGVAAEYDELPDGPVRDRVVEMVNTMLDSIAVIVAGGIREGHFRPSTDPQQVAFEVYAIMLGTHQSRRLLRDPGAEDRARAALDRLVDSIRQPAPVEETR